MRARVLSLVFSLVLFAWPQVSEGVDPANESAASEVGKHTKWQILGWEVTGDKSADQAMFLTTQNNIVYVEPIPFLAQVKALGVPKFTDGYRRPRWKKMRVVPILDLETDDRYALKLVTAAFSDKEILFVGTTVKHAGLKRELTARQLRLDGYGNVPVYQGTGGVAEDYPNIGNLAAAKSFNDEGRGILPEARRQELLKTPHSSKELQNALIRAFQEEDELIILLMAPGPDLAAVLKAHPEFSKKISRLVWMGGWVAVPATDKTPEVLRATFNWDMDPKSTVSLLEKVKQYSIPTTLWSSDVIEPHFKCGSVNRDNFPSITSLIEGFRMRDASYQEIGISGLSWDTHQIQAFPPLGNIIGPYAGHQFAPADPLMPLALEFPDLVDEAVPMDIEMDINDLDPARGYAVKVTPNPKSSISRVKKINLAVFEKGMLEMLRRQQAYKTDRYMDSIAWTPNDDDHRLYAEEIGGRFLETASDAGEPYYRFLDASGHQFSVNDSRSARIEAVAKRLKLPNPATFYFTDAEGDLPHLLSFEKQSDAFFEDAIAGRHFLRQNATFVFGGDAVDFVDPAGVLDELLTISDWSARQPDTQTVFLMGNRDLNKVRLHVELSPEAMASQPPPARDGTTYAAFLAERGRTDSRATRLIWVFDKTMGATGTFEKRHLRIALDLDRDPTGVPEEMVVDSFLSDLQRHRRMGRYLSRGKLAFLDGDTLYTHASLKKEGFLTIPGRPSKSKSVRAWVDELNPWYDEAIRRYFDTLFQYEKGEASVDALRAAAKPLKDYSDAAEGLTDNPASVAFARDIDANKMNKLPDPEIIEALKREGIVRVVKGDWNGGQLPFVLRTPDAGFELICGDNSSNYNFDSPSVIRLDKSESGGHSRVSLSGYHPVLERRVAIEYVPGQPSPLGMQLEDGTTVVNHSEEGWLGYRTDGRFSPTYSVVDPTSCAVQVLKRK